MVMVVRGFVSFLLYTTSATQIPTQEQYLQLYLKSNHPMARASLGVPLEGFVMVGFSLISSVSYKFKFNVINATQNVHLFCVNVTIFFLCIIFFQLRNWSYHCWVPTWIRSGRISGTGQILQQEVHQLGLVVIAHFILAFRFPNLWDSNLTPQLSILSSLQTVSLLLPLCYNVNDNF